MHDPTFSPEDLEMLNRAKDIANQIQRKLSELKGIVGQEQNGKPTQIRTRKELFNGKIKELVNLLEKQKY